MNAGLMQKLNGGRHVDVLILLSSKCIYGPGSSCYLFLTPISSFFYTAQLLWYLQSGYFHLRSLFAFMLVSERAQEPQPSMSALAVRPHLHSYLDSTSRL